MQIVRMHIMQDEHFCFYRPFAINYVCIDFNDDSRSAVQMGKIKEFDLSYCYTNPQSHSHSHSDAWKIEADRLGMTLHIFRWLSIIKLVFVSAMIFDFRTN